MSKSKSKTLIPKAPPQKKFKSTASTILSVVLGLIAAYLVSTIISIEVKGRRGHKSTAEWKELIKEHPYQRRDTDLRSPCPMLNTLANHGFIARDGRNIKSEELFDALMLMGAPPTVTVLILNFVYSQLQEAHPQDSLFAQFRSLKTLDLDRLTVFGVLEHDVSLTRPDSTLLGHSDTSLVVPEYVERMIRLAETKNQGDLKGTFTRENENDARKLRWMESIRDNRHMHLNFFSQFASSTECSLLLDIIGRDGSISLPHLKSFLLNESFPEDWYPRETTYTMKELATKPLICWHGLRSSKIAFQP
ncbi:peroxidase [Mucor ambiguus]|uniref:Peroxidase n=1 Tax=Mucor ambiguus TaxID=91626 RepID=A0A0C9MMY0_9FUNG|nr:peroxidase [Mucor ambiguus]